MQFQGWLLDEAAFKTANRFDREDARQHARERHVPSGKAADDLLEFSRLESEVLTNRLKQRLLKQDLVATGIPAGQTERVRIDHALFAGLELDIATSSVRDKNGIAFSGVLVVPPIHAPDAEKWLDGRPLADVIRDDVLGDPELVVEFWRFPPPPPYLALPPSPDAREEERARAWEAEHGTPEAAERRATELWADWIARVHASPLPLMATKERLEALWWPRILPPLPDAQDRRPILWRCPPLGAPDAGIVATRLAALRGFFVSGSLQAQGRKLLDEETGAYGPPEIVPPSILEDRNTHVRLVHGDLVAMEGGRVVAKWSEVTLIDPAPPQQAPVDRAPRSAAKGTGQRPVKRDLILAEGIAMMATPAPSANLTALASASDVSADGREEAPKRNGGGRPWKADWPEIIARMRADPEKLKSICDQKNFTVWADEIAIELVKELGHEPPVIPPGEITAIVKKTTFMDNVAKLAPDLLEIVKNNEIEHSKPRLQKSRSLKRNARKLPLRGALPAIRPA